MDIEKSIIKTQIIMLTIVGIGILFVMGIVSFLIYILWKWLFG